MVAYRGHSRFIPTGVGNASLLIGSTAETMVHPHGCGERFVFFYYSGVISGSSPRVWGTQLLKHQELFCLRFIPTGVGNATRLRFSYTRPTVHPHGCGERSVMHSVKIAFAGSSPRVWGTHNFQPEYQLNRRFIPTGVGNARSYLLLAHQIHGSSPRVWGTRFFLFQQPFYRRFIPTGVGNASTITTSPTLISVHPHGCGERAISSIIVKPSNGSSPRVWGTRIRIAPAQNTSLVHPHGCGER